MKAHAIMFLGTGSDVGKSIAATAFCRILKRRGFRVAPFKAQNMSNNSYVTVEGGEIGRAQVVQAEAAGLLPSVYMNPVLLKPSSGQSTQVVLLGKVAHQMSAMEYHHYKARLRKVVMEAFDKLASQYDVIVMEGAGSCCEMNLKDNDIVNFEMALATKAPSILVADIDRGGVFAQIIGSYQLMTREERRLILGFIINKFRGDPRLFASGIRYIEEKTGKPVLGLVPFYEDIHIDPEDSVVVQADKRSYRPLGLDTVNVAVIRLPAISNFTDFEVLEREPDVVLNYISRPKDLTLEYDWLILPGSKNVMSDTLWLRRRGWHKAIRAFAASGKFILGICGGYQLLGLKVSDPHGVESRVGQEVRGLALLPVATTLEREKVVQKVTGSVVPFGVRIRGYEIHMGRTKKLGRNGQAFARIHVPGRRTEWDDGLVTEDGLIMGTYIHGVLDSPGLRGEILNRIRAAKGLPQRKPRKGRLSRFKQYDKLADHFETHCDVERILSLAGIE